MTRRGLCAPTRGARGPAGPKDRAWGPRRGFQGPPTPISRTRVVAEGIPNPFFSSLLDWYSDLGTVSLWLILRIRSLSTGRFACFPLRPVLTDLIVPGTACQSPSSVASLTKINERRHPMQHQGLRVIAGWLLDQPVIQQPACYQLVYNQKTNAAKRVIATGQPNHLTINPHTHSKGN